MVSMMSEPQLPLPHFDMQKREKDSLQNALLVIRLETLHFSNLPGLWISVRYHKTRYKRILNQRCSNKTSTAAYGCLQGPVYRFLGPDQGSKMLVGILAPPQFSN